MNSGATTGLSRRRFLRIIAGTTAMVAGRGLPSAGAWESAQSRLVSWRGIALGAEVAIDLCGENQTACRAALAHCRSEILRLENIFSLYDRRSAVGRLNQFGRIQNPPRELCELIEYARGFSEITSGAFDLTIQPLHELLMEGGMHVRASDIECAAALVDFRAIACSGRLIHFSRAGMKITCNGIAQGFITDRVADLLQHRGFNHTLVDVGEKRALGGHPDGRPWFIGVESPLRDGAIVGSVELENCALATSGGYGGVFKHGHGHHLIDARAGACRDLVASLSVRAPTATLADTLSTCLAVLPAAEANVLLGKFPDCHAYIVRKPGDSLQHWKV